MAQKLPKLEDFRVGSVRIMKCITKELIQVVKQNDNELDENLVRFSINLFSLHPEYGLQFSGNITQSVFDNFMQICIDKFSSVSVQLKIIEMQMKFLLNPIDSGKIINGKRKILEVKSMKYVNRILNQTIVTKEDQDRLKSNLTIDSIVYNRLGNPYNQLTYMETLHVLDSIISKNDIISFSGLNVKAKMDSLQEIREIVCGIRVFNKDAGHNSEGVNNLPESVIQTCESTKLILNITICEIMDRTNLLTSALSTVVIFNKSKRDYEIVLNETNTMNDYSYIKDILIMNRQQEMYVKDLVKSLSHTKFETESLITNYRELLHEIHSIVQFKTAVATELVFVP